MLVSKHWLLGGYWNNNCDIPCTKQLCIFFVKKIGAKQIKRKHLYIHFVVDLIFYFFSHLISVYFFLVKRFVNFICSFLLYYIYLLFLSFDFKSESNIIRANFIGFRISLKPRNIMSNEILNVHVINFFLYLVPIMKPRV